MDVIFLDKLEEVPVATVAGGYSSHLHIIPLLRMHFLDPICQAAKGVLVEEGAGGADEDAVGEAGVGREVVVAVDAEFVVGVAY